MLECMVSNMAAVVHRKTTGLFAAKRALAFLSEVGCLDGDLIVRSDQEPAITSLVNEVGRLRGAAGGGRFTVEASPVGSSGSNGRVERAIQSVQDQVRVMRVALQDRWKVDVSHRHAVFPWMLEYAAHLLNRYEVGRDGRTAYERLKAKKAKPFRVHGEDRALPGGGRHGVSRDDREAADQHPRKAVGGRKELRNGEWCQQKIMLIDVKKAHRYGELEDHESAFVLPPDGQCEQGKCWRLRRWLYGMRLGETLLEDPRGHGLRDGGDSRDCVLRQGSPRSVRGARRRLHFSPVGGRPS